MRIGLNVLYVAQGLAGGRVYAEGLLRGLAEVDRDNEYLVFTRRDTALPDLPSGQFRVVRAPVGPRSTVWRTLWEYGLLPGQARRAGADLLHGLGSLSPRVRSCPLVLTIHDLIYLHHPESLPTAPRLFMHAVLPALARRAARIIVPSQATALDVIRHLRVPESRVRRIFWGRGNDLQVVTDAPQLDAVLRRHGLRRPFVLSVARGYPHKNLAGLLRAFALLPQDVQLAVVGEQVQRGSDLERLTLELGLGGRVVFTGYVKDGELPALYSAATLFAFPSLAEGFGFPVLEAMACGTPVVASDASAVPETVGPAGLIASARDPEAFATAMRTLLDSPALQERLRQEGLARAREYTWKRCAEQTLAVYREAHADR
jgi:glycosyltransferase involved in cell wall biosynthesis